MLYFFGKLTGKFIKPETKFSYCQFYFRTVVHPEDQNRKDVKIRKIVMILKWETLLIPNFVQTKLVVGLTQVLA